MDYSYQSAPIQVYDTGMTTRHFLQSREHKTRPNIKLRQQNQTKSAQRGYKMI
jgi:hypothetical protein